MGVGEMGGVGMWDGVMAVGEMGFGESYGGWWNGGWLKLWDRWNTYGVMWVGQN